MDSLNLSKNEYLNEWTGPISNLQNTCDITGTGDSVATGIKFEIWTCTCSTCGPNTMGLCVPVIHPRYTRYSSTVLHFNNLPCQPLLLTIACYASIAEEPQMSGWMVKCDYKAKETDEGKIVEYYVVGCRQSLPNISCHQIFIT